MGYSPSNAMAARVAQSAIRMRLKSVLTEIEFYAAVQKKRVDHQLIDLLDIYRQMIRLEGLLKQTIGIISADHSPDTEHRSTSEADSDGSNISLQLTDKEVEVLRLFSKGFSYNETAHVLNCKISTIQTHTKRIYKKLDVHSRAEAVYEFQAMLEAAG